MFLSMRKKLCGFRACYVRDSRGTVAIEFAFVIIPFFFLIFAQTAVGLYYFTTFSLEYSIEEAARSVRTGETQQSLVTKGEFKSTVCNLAPSFMDCDQYLRVNVIEFSGDFASIAAPSCLDSAGALAPDPPASDAVPGSAERVVLVIACYEWTLINYIPFVNTSLGNMPNGSVLIRAATTFETEPYS